MLRTLGDAPGFAGSRNRSFFGILLATGCRVNALRLLDGSHCVAMPNGRLRIYLHEKGKGERREVELSRKAAVELHDYAEAFNESAAPRSPRSLVRLGECGSVWRNTRGQPWGYTSILHVLEDGCQRAGVASFTPHALRRAFATDAASQLPRHVVACAGGWSGLERLDDHYVGTRERTIWEKLSGTGHPGVMSGFEEEVTGAATVAV